VTWRITATSSQNFASIRNEPEFKAVGSRTSSATWRDSRAEPRRSLPTGAAPLDWRPLGQKFLKEPFPGPEPTLTGRTDF